jgi:hypothetical protein
MRRRRERDEISGKEKNFFFLKTQICEYRTQIEQSNSDVVTTRTDNISKKFHRNVDNETPEHRTEKAPKALFWKSA